MIQKEMTWADGTICRHIDDVNCDVGITLHEDSSLNASLSACVKSSQIERGYDCTPLHRWTDSHLWNRWAATRPPASVIYSRWAHRLLVGKHWRTHRHAALPNHGLPHGRQTYVKEFAPLPFPAVSAGARYSTPNSEGITRVDYKVY